MSFSKITVTIIALFIAQSISTESLHELSQDNQQIITELFEQYLDQEVMTDKIDFFNIDSFPINTMLYTGMGTTCSILKHPESPLYYAYIWNGYNEHFFPEETKEDAHQTILNHSVLGAFKRLSN